MSILGLLTLYKRDSPTFLIETGAPKEEVLVSVASVFDFDNMTENDRSAFKNEIEK
jgi:hypothetical protein